ncbi:hypothetical protein [Allomuricauda sp. R78024]|uniref:hypothetical protein n=1 Tax=Allomuricauda sp. R78024 TaxID=3093867 RepID=UPI0037CBCE55
MNKKVRTKSLFTGLITASMILLSACSSMKKCQNGEMGTLKILDLDGCGWVIELKSGDKLQPINLDSFEVTKQEGLSVSLSYTEVNDMASICMAGKMVNLTCLEVQQ